MEQVSNSLITLVELKPSLVPARWENGVRTLRSADCNQVGLSLSHSFAADDLSQYILDGEDMSNVTAERKWKVHVNIMTYITAAHIMKGVATAIGPDLDCVALWLPPGVNVEGWWTSLRSGLWKLNYMLSPEGRKRYYGELLPMLHDTKLEVMGERDNDCYYLVYLGTKPNSRGRGYAAQVLGDLIKRADKDSRPIYLESSSLSNNEYYKKFGFEVRKDIVLTRGSHPVLVTIMVREPQAPSLPTSCASSNFKYEVFDLEC